MIDMSAYKVLISINNPKINTRYIIDRGYTAVPHHFKLDDGSWDYTIYRGNREVKGLDLNVRGNAVSYSFIDDYFLCFHIETHRGSRGRCAFDYKCCTANIGDKRVQIPLVKGMRFCKDSDHGWIDNYIGSIALIPGLYKYKIDRKKNRRLRELLSSIVHRVYMVRNLLSSTCQYTAIQGDKQSEYFCDAVEAAGFKFIDLYSPEFLQEDWPCIANNYDKSIYLRKGIFRNTSMASRLVVTLLGCIDSLPKDTLPIYDVRRRGWRGQAVSYPSIATTMANLLFSDLFSLAEKHEDKLFRQPSKYNSIKILDTDLVDYLRPPWWDWSKHGTLI